MLKFIVVGFCVCFAQRCLSVPTDSAGRFDQLNLTRSDVEKIRTDLKAIAGIDPKAVDELINLVGMTQRTTSDADRAEAYTELLLLAVNANYTKEQAIDWIDENLKNDSMLNGPITEETLKRWEEKLTPKLTKDQFEGVTTIFRGLRVDAPYKERHNAFLLLITSAGYNKLAQSTTEHSQAKNRGHEQLTQLIKQI